MLSRACGIVPLLVKRLPFVNASAFACLPTSRLLFTSSLLRSAHRAIPQHGTKYYWRKYLDVTFLYITLGGIPFALALFYANVYVSDAILTEIPDDYEPESHEYLRNPIRRWFQKNIYRTPERLYEKNMSVYHFHEQHRRLNLRDREVRELMGRRQDYKGWYWVPQYEEFLKWSQASTRWQEEDMMAREYMSDVDSAMSSEK